MKIRIFALAKELDMDSKLLIDYCAKAGIVVKNSALASISPEERDRVMEIIRTSGPATMVANAGQAGGDVAPTRDLGMELAGKVRQLRNMLPKTPVQKPVSASVESDDEPVEESVEPAQPVVAEAAPPHRPVAAEQRAAEAPASAPPAGAGVGVPTRPNRPTNIPPGGGPIRQMRSMGADGMRAGGPLTRSVGGLPAGPLSGRGAGPLAGRAAGGPSPVAPPSVSEEVPAEQAHAVEPPLPPPSHAGNPPPQGNAPTVGVPVRPIPPRSREMSSIGSPDRSMRNMGGGSIRDMNRGSGAPGQGRSDQGRQDQGRPDQGSGRPDQGGPLGNRGSRPSIAQLTPFKPVAGKQEELKPQAPDIRIAADGSHKAASPLGKRLLDKQKSSKDGGPEGDEGSRGGRRGERPGGAGASMEDVREQRRQKRTKDGRRGDDDEMSPGRLRKMPRRGGARGNVVLKTEAEISLPITVRSLSEAIGRPVKPILKLLWDKGEMLVVNSFLHEETATEIALELGVDLKINKPKDVEDELQEYIDAGDDESLMTTRPPIITILGHVDHGKTTLVDRLRSANVAAGEHGGITQHIAAYQVNKDGKRLTFVDTPGHAAFGEMRARGANVTDIIVLVVAANDGVMPQTVECIAHAKAAGVPMVVALNKCDLPDRNEQRVLQELAAQDVLAAEWGGDIEVVRTSGLTGAGLDDLLDTLLLTSELHEFKANAERPAIGACLEAFRDEGHGPVAWAIVQKGTLRKGDVVLCGKAFGRVRAMFNEYDQEIEEAGPSTPVKIAGLDIIPSPGDAFLVLDDLELVRDIAEQRRKTGRQATLAARGGKRTLDDILNAAREGEIQELGIIVKADTPGSIEALRHEIEKFEHEEVRIKILHEGVGGVNESDVYLASASGATIVAFHVIADVRAEMLAQQEEVEIRRYNIIYEVMDEIKQTLEGMLKPGRKEVTLGRAIVLQTFSISRFGTIAGCRVLNGTIERSNRIHLIRDQKMYNSYGIASLRREKDDVRDVREGMECGIRLEGFNDIREGDLLEAYRIDEVKRKLE